MLRSDNSAPSRTRVIAEAGVNHNGSLELALELVAVASRAGADVVKFQTFRAGALVAKSAPKADYQKRSTGADETQLAMLQRLELSLDAHQVIAAACQRAGIEFMSSPFDSESLAFLVDEMKVATIKLGSGELTNAPLLIDAARSGRELILSTGMATLGEVEDALGVLAFAYRASDERPSRAAFRRAFLDPQARRAVRERVTLLHCTSEYPAAFADVNLHVMKTLRRSFDVRVGFSDHTPGISVAMAATALGASVIEKHFTTDRSLPGPDHQASLTPDELSALVRGVREIESALGSTVKVPSGAETATATVARKSVVAAREIAEGQVITRDDLCAKRPGTGRSPLDLFDLVGRRATRAYQIDEVIDE
jgi:N-acetylneuraminate synthase